MSMRKCYRSCLPKHIIWELPVEVQKQILGRSVLANHFTANQMCVTSEGTWLENAPIHNEGETRTPRGREVLQ